jgi:hypothetical protein
MSENPFPMMPGPGDFNRRVGDAVLDELFDRGGFHRHGKSSLCSGFAPPGLTHGQ